MPTNDPSHKLSQAVADSWSVLDLLDDGFATLTSSGTILRCNPAFRLLVGREHLHSRDLAAELRAQCLAAEAAHGKWEEVKVTLPGSPTMTLRRRAIALDTDDSPQSAHWLLIFKDTSLEAEMYEKNRLALAQKRVVQRRVRMLAAAVTLVLAGLSGAMGWAYFSVYRTYDVPLPDIRRSSSPAAIARGERIFSVSCAGCHVPGMERRMAGLQARDLGTIPMPNISADTVGGIGGWTDEELARTITAGLRRDGTLALGMPAFEGMGTEDVAALIGFMRSGHEYFAPDPQIRSRPTLTFSGVMTLAYQVGVGPRAKVNEVPAPPKGPTAAYGQYLTTAVYRCWDCHTEGVSRDRINSPLVFGGGAEFIDEQGRSIFSPNLTFDNATGLGQWTLPEFTRAIRDGVSRDGFIIQPPMQRFRGIDNVEIEAIYNYFQSLPHLVRAPRAARNRLSKPAAGANAAELYAELGCRLCHGWKAPFDARIRAAANKPMSSVAEWIRNPQQFKPSTQMPTFADLIDESQALSLAEWLQKSARTGK